MEKTTSTDSVLRVNASLERVERRFDSGAAYADWEITIKVEAPEGALIHAIGRFLEEYNRP
jgi:hypothetical protein